VGQFVLRRNQQRLGRENERDTVINSNPLTEKKFSTTKSARALERARQCIAGGDSSTMRVLPYHLPFVVDKGEGSKVWDVDGNKYIDLNMAYGPLILGHCPPQVIKSVTEQITQRGSALGFPNELNSQVGEKVKQLFPAIELMRFANSGTEAIASAIRLARTYTGRKKIILFEGHYHGWSEGLFHRYHAEIKELPKKGYGPALSGTAGMNGGPHEVIVCGWNDLDLLHQCLAEHGDEVAGCIMEPVMGNAGVIPPDPQFLAGAREALHECGALLIYDEVITGMRIDSGGAQELYGVQPDITILSKAVGGGYPIALFGTTQEIMQPILDGTMFHGGVYSSNAIVMSAANAVLDTVLDNKKGIYKYLHRISDRLAGGIKEILQRLNVPAKVHNVGPMISIFLTKGEVGELRNYRDVRQHCDFKSFIKFQHEMQRCGVYLHPNMFEPIYLSTAHTDDDITSVLESVEDAAKTCLVL